MEDPFDLEELPALEEIDTNQHQRKRKSLPSQPPPQMSPVKKARRGIKRSKSVQIDADPTRTDDSNLSNVAQGKVSSLQSVTTNNSDDEAKSRKTKESKTGLAKLIEKAKQIVNDQSQVRRKKFTKKVKKNPTVEQHPELSTDEDDDLPLAT